MELEVEWKFSLKWKRDDMIKVKCIKSHPTTHDIEKDTIYYLSKVTSSIGYYYWVYDRDKQYIRMIDHETVWYYFEKVFKDMIKVKCIKNYYGFTNTACKDRNYYLSSGKSKEGLSGMYFDVYNEDKINLDICLSYETAKQYFMEYNWNEKEKDMNVCHCTLGGTEACKYCPNNSNTFEKYDVAKFYPNKITEKYDHTGKLVERIIERYNIPFKTDM